MRLRNSVSSASGRTFTRNGRIAGLLAATCCALACSSPPRAVGSDAERQPDAGADGSAGTPDGGPLDDAGPDGASRCTPPDAPTDDLPPGLRGNIAGAYHRCDAAGFCQLNA